MDNQTLIAIAAIVLANIGTTIGLFMWATNHAATDTQNNRENTHRLLEAIHAEMKGFHAEMKDFHGRLCKIEESRNRQ